MKIYLSVVANHISIIDSEPFNDDNPVIIECSNIDELSNKINDLGYEGLSEFDEKISELFNEDEHQDQEMRFSIKHWVVNRSIGELVDMYENNEILKPGLQRNFVWDSSRSSKLIESVLMGLPIPSLFMYEVENNKYEIIDGLQRITVFYNFIKGNSWSGEKGRKSRINSIIRSDLKGKSFDELSDDDKRILKRSTVPVIEFRQLSPNNQMAKYLIFERINSGSVKLSNMQIRKALAYGLFIKSLYDVANKNSQYCSLFSFINIKNDIHVEALLRVLFVIDIINGNYSPANESFGLMLNKYCESRKNKPIGCEEEVRFNEAIAVLFNLYRDKNNVCKRILIEDGQVKYSNSLQMTYLETITAVLMNEKNIFIDGFEERFKDAMVGIYDYKYPNVKQSENPFSYSTAKLSYIRNRYDIIKEILAKDANL